MIPCLKVERTDVLMPAHEAWKLAEELREHLDALWDIQFEQDVKAGRLDDVIARPRDEYATGT